VSLRGRLTLLNIVVVGGGYILFGALAYGVSSVLLYDYVDTSLQTVVDQLLEQGRIEGDGGQARLSLDLSRVPSDVYVQVWDRQYRLIESSSLALGEEALDPHGLRLSYPLYRNVNQLAPNWSALRVLSVPLMAEKRLVGVVQAAVRRERIVTMQMFFLWALLLAGLVGIAIVILFSHLMIERFLSPIEAIARTAEQINQADDLSRRIPYEGSEDDEVGQLVSVINRTLERLEVLFASQQRFLADVSHELRTPLTVIKGNVDLMRRMKEFDAELLDSIDQEAARLTRLVTDLLFLAKAEAGALPLILSPVELDTLLLEVMGEMRVLAGTRVRMHLTEIDQIRIVGDRDRLKQVFLNLISNAIQYTPSGGEVFLGLTRVGDHAKFVVRDTGPGIPAEDLPHIFERFYRAEKSRTRSSLGGFGLGLSIAHWIVTQHRGRIEVSSKEGQGTMFAVWLPIAPSAE